MSNCFYIFKFHLFLTDGLFSFTIKTLFTRTQFIEIEIQIVKIMLSR